MSHPAPLRLFDVVAITAAIPDYGLVRGQVGTLVEPLAEGVWLVEFADRDGRTYAMVELEEEALLPLLFEEVAA